MAQTVAEVPPPVPMSPAPPLLIACPDCAAIQEMPPPPAHGRLACCRCGHVLEETAGRSLDAALACAIATLLLLLPANLLALMTVHVAGITESTQLASGLGTFWRQGWPALAVILGLQGIVLPFVRFGLLVATLGALRLGIAGAWVGPAFRWSERLDPWAMADVLAIGLGVGYGRVASQIPVTIGGGGWCFIGAALFTMLTRAVLERRAVWRRIAAPPAEVGRDAIGCVDCDLALPGELQDRRCPRCRAVLHRRKPFAYQRCLALVIASCALIPIAYWLPMSVLWEAGTVQPHSIIDGIILLFGHGFWPLGILICLASVGIPLGKLIGLTWCLAATRRGSPHGLRQRTRVYRVIDDIGRWSNLDPLTVLIFAPMVQFGQLAHIQVKGGSLAFLAMVVLSMIAARVFDPRIMWDAAEAGAADAAAAARAPA